MDTLHFSNKKGHLGLFSALKVLNENQIAEICSPFTKGPLKRADSHSNFFFATIIAHKLASLTTLKC